MTKTPQWAIDAAEDLLRFMEHSVEFVAKRIAHHASTDPIRELAGKLVERVLEHDASYCEHIAHELKKALEE